MPLRIVLQPLTEQQLERIARETKVDGPAAVLRNCLAVYSELLAAKQVGGRVLIETRAGDLVPVSLKPGEAG